MRRNKIIIILIALTVFFLVTQLLIYRYILKSDSVKRKSNIEIQDSVWLFLSTSYKHSIPVFIIEPSILRKFIGQTEPSNIKCSLDCHNGQIVTFGSFHGNLSRVDVLINDLKGKHFTIHQSTVNSDQTYHHLITTHYILHQRSTISTFLHLVVFYERGDFLWHGAVLAESLKFIPQLQIKFGKTAGAYDKFQLKTVQLDGQSVLIPNPSDDFLQQIPHSTFLECNHTRTKHFYSLYPRDTSQQALHFQRKARQLIARGRQLLLDLQIPFWLSSGTCLGWFRQCDIFPYAKDVDFGIFIKDYKPELVTGFQRVGLPLKHIFGKESDSFELSFQAGEVKLDIFFFYEESDHIWNGGTDYITGQKFKYYFPRFTLCWTVLLELRVRVPCQTQQYLEANYGQDWFTPIRHWDWKSSPPNVQENNLWSPSELDTVIQVY